jgi:hypothetical protein
MNPADNSTKSDPICWKSCVLYLMLDIGVGWNKFHINMLVYDILGQGSLCNKFYMLHLLLETRSCLDNKV